MQLTPLTPQTSFAVPIIGWAWLTREGKGGGGTRRGASQALHLGGGVKKASVGASHFHAVAPASPPDGVPPWSKSSRLVGQGGFDVARVRRCRFLIKVRLKAANWCRAECGMCQLARSVTCSRFASLDMKEPSDLLALSPALSNVSLGCG